VPHLQVAFIDEIFKANSAILNALLTLLNERLFDNGNMRSPVPLLTLVCKQQRLRAIASADKDLISVDVHVMHRLAPPMSCLSQRSWTHCLTASCSGMCD
jgi:hypothetical protein